MLFQYPNFIHNQLKNNNVLMGRTDLRSQTLDLLRFPLAVVVLMIHTFTTKGLQVRGEELQFTDYPLFMEVNYWIDGFLRGQSVPIYYFISGFVFFLGVEMTKETYLRKFKNRVKSLVIPYFIWNAIAVLLMLGISFNPLFSHYTAGHNFHFSWSSLLSCFWVYDGGLSDVVIDSDQSAMHPMNVPLWFVRDLIIVVLCTPILHVLIKRVGRYFVWLLGIIWFVVPYLHLQTLGFQSAFFFFSWGAYMSINRKDMLQVFGRYFKASVFLYLLLGVLHVAAAHYWPEAQETIKQLNVLVGLLFAYNFAAWLLKRGTCRVNPFLASASFFVYVSHSLVVGRMLKLLFITFSPASDGALLLVYTLAVILTVLLLLAAFYVMRRYTPSLLRVIAGRK